MFFLLTHTDLNFHFFALSGLSDMKRFHVILINTYRFLQIFSIEWVWIKLISVKSLLFNWYIYLYRYSLEQSKKSAFEIQWKPVKINTSGPRKSVDVKRSWPYPYTKTYSKIFPSLKQCHLASHYSFTVSHRMSIRASFYCIIDL